MKRLAIVFFLVSCVPILHAQKPRYGQEPPMAKAGVSYPIKVHISGIQIRRYCDAGNCEDVVHADAVMNQQKIELTGGFIFDHRFFRLNLRPGDYVARLLKTARDTTMAPLQDEYEVLLPDRTVWRCAVTGISE
jgi:hypothetical protein